MIKGTLILSSRLYLHQWMQFLSFTQDHIVPYNYNLSGKSGLHMLEHTFPTLLWNIFSNNLEKRVKKEIFGQRSPAVYPMWYLSFYILPN